MKNELYAPSVGTDLYEPPYQSAGERVIGRLLDHYGLPFFYRQSTIVDHQGRNEIWRPSFTLPQYAGAVIDYLQNADRSGLEARIGIYRYNQIPAAVLGPADLDKPCWRQELYEQLRKELKLPHYTLDHILKRQELTDVQPGQ